MNIPRDHHYLPRFYLDRWTRNGKVFRYVRPLGKEGPMDGKWKPPSAIAYERDLYQQPDISGLAESQALELRFFQKIDDRAAVALRKLDQHEQGSEQDRVALSQFIISLLHRSPSRLRAIRTELAKRTDGAPYKGLKGRDFDKVLKSTANRLLAMLVESPEGTSILSKFKAFRIDTGGASKKLLTSDRPITVSAQLIASDAFIILPYAPDRLVVLTHHEPIASSFSSQDPNTLVEGINQAVVEQSEDMVVAADESATRMINRLFLRPQPDRVLDSIGLIRRKSPLINLKPKTRNFSRHNKSSLRYL
ncbi:DUF4238 domain-containing protein [Parasphingorhabdus sp.]|uniref:DUF4238 domain-containing protein n=1 Tax=Parasphingorhabdus sp. TaxID=2709688 RepID=UPI003A922856